MIQNGVEKNEWIGKVARWRMKLVNEIQWMKRIHTGIISCWLTEKADGWIGYGGTRKYSILKKRWSCGKYAVNAIIAMNALYENRWDNFEG